MPLFQDNRGKWNQQKINLGRFWNSNFKTKFFFSIWAKIVENRIFWSRKSQSGIFLSSVFWHHCVSCDDDCASLCDVMAWCVTSYNDVWRRLSVTLQVITPSRRSVLDNFFRRIELTFSIRWHRGGQSYRQQAHICLRCSQARISLMKY